MATFKKIDELPVITEIPGSAKVVIYDPEQLVEFNKVSTVLVSTLLDVHRGTYADITGPVPIWNQDTTGNSETSNHAPYDGLMGPIPIWNQDTTGNADRATLAELALHSNTSTYASHANTATFVVNATYVTTANTSDHTPYSGLTGDVTIWNQDTTGTANNSLHFGGELPEFYTTNSNFVIHSHTVTAEQVGLGNVTNESKTTLFSNPTFTGTVSGVTKAHVGLGNADNTSDDNKPVSTSQQDALNLKSNIASPTFTGTVTLPLTTNIGTTTLGYFNNVTSNIQTQINTKAPTHSPSFTGIVEYDNNVHATDSGLNIGAIYRTGDLLKIVHT